MMRGHSIALLCALAAAAGGCGKLLGIHDSHARVLDGGAGRHVDGAAGRDGDGGGAAGAIGAAGVGAGGGGSGAAGAGSPSDAGADADGRSDGAPTDIPVDTPSPPMCQASAPTTVTAFVFTSGPRGTGTGQCSFPNSIPLPSNRYYGAIGMDLYAGASACGACLHVETLDGSTSIIMQIIDSTNTGQINVEPTGHSQLSVNGNNPMVRIRFVPCDYGPPPPTIKLAFETNGYAAPLFFDNRNRLKNVDIRATGSTSAWISMTRQNYNRWTTSSALGSGAADLRLTDEAGSIIMLGNQAVTPIFRDTGRQFPVCVVAN